MNFRAKTVRRAFGTVCLLLAVALLVAGETVLEGRMSAPVFLVFWMACFLFTILAIVAAMIDFRAVRNEGREQQRELLQKTLGKIERKDNSRN